LVVFFLIFPLAREANGKEANLVCSNKGTTGTKPPSPAVPVLPQGENYRSGIRAKTKGKRMKRIFGILSLMITTVSYADTETIKWYVDGNVYNTTTCQSGGNVTLPTQPSKPGYTFVGWQVALYDFSTLDPSVAGTNYTYNASTMTWATIFPYGLVSGKAVCSITPGTYAVAGTPDESTGGGQYCWCKATAYTPSGSNIAYENSSSSAWVFNDAYGTASECASSCASYCGNRVQTRAAAFRRTVFGVTQ
jgi:uncharacterized repeat protein (TIGR02543 family)